MNMMTSIWSEVGKVISTYFGEDKEVMSPEIKKIMSNQKDRKEYLQAIDRLRNNKSQEEEITLSDKNKMTITLNH